MDLMLFIFYQNYKDFFFSIQKSPLVKSLKLNSYVFGANTKWTTEKGKTPKKEMNNIPVVQLNQQAMVNASISSDQSSSLEFPNWLNIIAMSMPCTIVGTATS